MKTRILPLALLAAALAGCGQANHASLEFLGICSNPAPTNTGCLYQNTCGTIADFVYWYDPAAAVELLVPIEMFNQMPNNADASSGRVNTNDAVIQQWRLEVRYGSLVVATVNAGVNLVVPANSHQVAIVPVLPVNLNTMMRGFYGWEFSVRVRAAGRYLDETYFETGPFNVPVQILYAPTPRPCTPPAYAWNCPQPGQAGTPGCVTP